MKKYLKVTPEGTKDFLFAECSAMDDICGKIEKKTYSVAADIGGSWAGSALGAKGGAWAGATIGTAILPGVGTAVGGIAGGLILGVAGSFAGSSLGKWVVDITEIGEYPCGS